MVNLKNPPKLPFDISDAELWAEVYDVEYFSIRAISIIFT